MILRGSLTSRTHRTPRLFRIFVVIVFIGAVQTLLRVLSGIGAGGTGDTGGLVVRVTNTLQEVAGGASEPLCAGPGAFRTLETALGVGIENMVRQTAVETVCGVE